MKSKQIMLSALLAICFSSANAAILFSNGGPSGDSGWCNTANSCGGSWMIRDNFTLTSASTITGFSFWNTQNNGPVSAYRSTTYNFTNSGFNTSYGSGVSIATINDPAGQFFETIISGLNIQLAAGTYWLGVMHDAGGSIYSYATTNNGFANAFQTAGNTSTLNISNLRDAAFTIYGESTQKVPEPTSFALLGLGLAGLSAMRRRQKSA